MAGEDYKGTVIYFDGPRVEGLEVGNWITEGSLPPCCHDFAKKGETVCLCGLHVVVTTDSSDPQTGEARHSTIVYTQRAILTVTIEVDEAISNFENGKLLQPITKGAILELIGAEAALRGVTVDSVGFPEFQPESIEEVGQYKLLLRTPDGVRNCIFWVLPKNNLNPVPDRP